MVGPSSESYQSFEGQTDFNGCHICIGTFAGANTLSGHHNIFIGDNTGTGVIRGNYNVIIGTNIPGVDGSGQFILGDIEGFEHGYVTQGFYNMYPMLLERIVNEWLPVLTPEHGAQLIDKMSHLRDTMTERLREQYRTGTFSFVYPPEGVTYQIGGNQVQDPNQEIPAV
jgi:hypothetical protein